MWLGRATFVGRERSGWITRLVLLPLVVITAWSGGVGGRVRGRRADPGSWLMYRFSHWDSHLYAALAIRGYPQVDYPHSYFSFLPGFPLAAAHREPTGVEVGWTGLAIVTVCGLVSAVLLWQLAYEMTGRSDAARWAVICYAVAPLTVFFSVVYTEAPFIALALGAWLCGRRRRWGWAGLLAGLACTLRITGPLLVVGLAVMYVQTEGRGPMKWRLRPSALTLMSGPLFVVGYFAWLRAGTGQWDAWTTAQREGFGRASAPPWVGLEDALHKLMTADSGHLESGSPPGTRSPAGSVGGRRLADPPTMVARGGSTRRSARCRCRSPPSSTPALGTFTQSFPCLSFPARRVARPTSPASPSSLGWGVRARGVGHRGRVGHAMVGRLGVKSRLVVLRAGVPASDRGAAPVVIVEVRPARVGRLAVCR